MEWRRTMKTARHRPEAMPRHQTPPPRATTPASSSECTLRSSRRRTELFNWAAICACVGRATRQSVEMKAATAKLRNFAQLVRKYSRGGTADAD